MHSCWVANDSSGVRLKKDWHAWSLFYSTFVDVFVTPILQVFMLQFSGMLFVDVVWCICNWCALSDSCFCLLFAYFSWLLYNVWAPFFKRTPFNCRTCMCLLLDSSWLQGFCSILHSKFLRWSLLITICSPIETTFCLNGAFVIYNKHAWFFDANPYLHKCTGASASKLFYFILCNIPPYIPKPTIVARTVELYWKWGCSSNAWCCV